MTPRDYLVEENTRNRNFAPFYEALLKLALGTSWVVLTGHHFLYERDGDAATEGEIPSADTVLFDPAIMGAVFGPKAPRIMQAAVMLPPGDRDAYVSSELTAITGVTYPALHR